MMKKGVLVIDDEIGSGDDETMDMVDQWLLREEMTREWTERHSSPLDNLPSTSH